MNVYVNGNQISLNQTHFLAQGGEGSVYVRNGLAYKIYEDPSKSLPISKIKELRAINCPEVITPQDIVMDGQGNSVGYTMRFVDNTYPLAQIMSKSFRSKNGLTPKLAFGLLKQLQDLIQKIHRAGVLVVDLNTMNFIVSKDYKKLYAIDTDSYQTKSHRATAIMPSIRDWTTPITQLSENTDWFSFAIVAFQLLTCRHPYRGKHPTVKGFENRIKQRLSVFNSEVRAPKVGYPISIIPKEYLQWFKSVLEFGKRLPPPNCAGTITFKPILKVLQGTNHLDIQELFKAREDIKAFAVRNGKEVVVTSSLVYVNRRHYPNPVPKTKPCFVGFTPTQNHTLLAWVDNNQLQIYDLDTKKNLSLNLLVEQVLSTPEGRLYVKSSDKILELNFVELSGNVLVGSKQVANVLPLATTFYEGVSIQNILGKYNASIFPTSGRHHQVFLNELSKYKILHAKLEANVLIVEATKAGKTDRFVFRFDAQFKSYDLRKTEDVTPTHCNFVCLGTGVCVSLISGDTLELFSSRKGSSQVQQIQDNILDDQMFLTKRENTLLFFHEEKLFSLRKK